MIQMWMWSIWMMESNAKKIKAIDRVLMKPAVAQLIIGRWTVHQTIEICMLLFSSSSSTVMIVVKNRLTVIKGRSKLMSLEKSQRISSFICFGKIFAFNTTNRSSLFFQCYRTWSSEMCRLYGKYPLSRILLQNSFLSSQSSRNRV